jgi:small-conductance mechanosensitive channel
LQLRHELHGAIGRAFRSANIAIAFPQRDIYIRSVQHDPSGRTLAAAEGNGAHSNTDPNEGSTLSHP